MFRTGFANQGGQQHHWATKTEREGGERGRGGRCAGRSTAPAGGCASEAARPRACSDGCEGEAESHCKPEVKRFGVLCCLLDLNYTIMMGRWTTRPRGEMKGCEGGETTEQRRVRLPFGHRDLLDLTNTGRAQLRVSHTVTACAHTRHRLYMRF